MIQSLEDLKAHTVRLAETLPEQVRAGVILKSPGCTQEECDLLKSRLPGIPESYLKCAASLKLTGISIGYFNLWPSGFQGKSLVETLLSANSADNPFYATLRTFELYHVASWEADALAVASHQSPFSEGVVVKLDEAKPDSPPIRLAANFATLLLLAGNLDELRGRHVGGKKAVGLFIETVRLFDADPQGISAWRTIAETVLL